MSGAMNFTTMFDVPDDPVKDVNLISDASGAWHDQFVSMVGSVNFYTMFHKNQLRAAKFRNGHRHHDRVAEKRRASAQQTDSMH